MILEADCQLQYDVDVDESKTMLYCLRFAWLFDALVGCLRLCHCLIVVIGIIFVLVSVTTYRVLSLVIDVDVELSMLLSLLLLFIIVKVLFSSSLLSSR